MPRQYWEAELEAIVADAVRRIVESGGAEAPARAAVEQAVSRAIESSQRRKDAEDTAHFGPPD